MSNNELSNRMDFDHVVYVDANGVVSDANDVHPYFELYVDEYGRDDFTIEPGWELMSGYTGQYGYSGPVMHPSEFIGGTLAYDILNTPGYYVALTVSDYSGEVIGWAIARKVDE